MTTALLVLALLASPIVAGMAVTVVRNMWLGSVARRERSRTTETVATVLVRERARTTIDARTTVDRRRVPLRAWPKPERPETVWWRRTDTAEGVVQGVLGSLPLVHALAEVDSATYATFTQLAGRQMERFADLHDTLASWPSASLGAGLPDGALSKLAGHLAEHHVAEHLRELGGEVAVADASNQVGWDLVLGDGAHLNVKTLQHASLLADHFARYPEVAAIVPGDMAGIPDGAIVLDSPAAVASLESLIASGAENVVAVDPMLSHDAVFDQAESVSDLALGHLDLDPLAHFPFVTAAISGWREARLLASGHTTALRGAKNLALDVTGTGVGGLAGGKGGALIGTVVWPGVGTVVGGLIGGIVGVLAGRAVTNRVKASGLRAARERLRTEAAACRTQAAWAVANARQHHRAAVASETVALQRRAGDAQAGLREGGRTVAVEREGALCLLPAELPALRDQTSAAIDAELAALRAAEARRGFWRRFVWPLREHVASKVHADVLQRARRIVERHTANPPAAPLVPLEESITLLDALLATGIDPLMQLAREHVRRANERRRNGEAQLLSDALTRCRELADARGAAIARIRALRKELAVSVKAQLEPLAARVHDACRAVESEARRLGLAR